MTAVATEDDRPILTDGGMGEALAGMGLRQAGSPFWSGRALIEAPEAVLGLHRDFIRAGADLIITNTYGVVRSFMAEIGIEERFRELNLKALDLARQAVDAEKRDILIAGSLPPLSDSYLPDEVESDEILAERYAEQAGILADGVDLFICETLTTVAETRAVSGGGGGHRQARVDWLVASRRTGSLAQGRH